MKEEMTKFLSLNIQMFAEDETDSMVTTTENVEADASTEESTPAAEEKKERVYSRSEVNKMLNAERNKVRAEVLQEAETKKTEAEKLAKMDAEQKLNYELEKSRAEVETYKSQINALTLSKEATSYATEKGLPIGYIEDFDFAKETAESVKDKIDKLVELRSKDLSNYLNDKLKQPVPKAVETTKVVTDPYLQGFQNYMKNKK